jgi:hypothetical protein
MQGDQTDRLAALPVSSTGALTAPSNTGALTAPSKANSRPHQECALKHEVQNKGGKP